MESTGTEAKIEYELSGAIIRDLFLALPPDDLPRVPHVHPCFARGLLCHEWKQTNASSAPVRVDTIGM